jgi:desampylase
LTSEISAGALAGVLRHAREAAPEECCGILLGRVDAGAISIAEAHPARNIADRRETRFAIDPADHFAVIREARRRGLEVVGFYHSHPRSAAEPSETDRLEAGGSGDLWLIVGASAGGPDVRLFRALAGNFLPIALVTAPE